MFNWVCPQCGKDVPPSKTECPNCAERAREAAAAPPPPQQPWQPPPPQAWQPPPPPPQQHQGPPQQWQQQAPQYPPYPQQQPPPPAAWQHHAQRSGPPTWLMGLLFAVAFVLIFALVYFGIQRFSRTNPAEKAGLENPANPSLQKVANPLQKYVEVVGVRLVSENKKPTARFVVVNHSNAEITGLEANVTLWASTSRSEEDSVGSFSFKANSIPPNGSADMSAPLKTKMKPYELPDWQNATAELQITSPQ